jgi:UDP-N-acetylglucosamine/UDP-N-acetylgalactosamine diphosphorylase
MEQGLMPLTKEAAKALLENHNQDHLLHGFDTLSPDQQSILLAQIEAIQFPLVERLVSEWIFNEPSAETFTRIDPVPVIAPVQANPAAARDALRAGEEALRHDRVGLVMVAGGQGTRLGFDGPKGAYPIGPATGWSIFAYHAAKIRNVQRRYGCALPWYIMVSETNDDATQAFFREHDYFGLNPEDVIFFRQRMMPCVDEDGKFMIDSPGNLARNPNGHGGTIPALVESGIFGHARDRGIESLTYVQVDNWAVKVADPYFIGYHVAGESDLSSKVHRKVEPRESVGVHCICDGEYRTIEYTELDLYPQLLDTDDEGDLIHFAGNPAIHIVAVDFVERMYKSFDQFPWHRAHKKVPYLNETGQRVEPDVPNAYKFETFIFDALRYAKSDPVALEILAPGEYTPIKQFDGPNSVVEARQSMSALWAGWLEAAGCKVPQSGGGAPAVDIEISPAFAMDQDEFVERAKGMAWPSEGPIVIDDDGKFAHETQTQ